MAEDFRLGEISHNVILEGPERLSISGVTEVVSFDEEEVVMETARGLLTVTGSDLHVDKLSLDIGELSLQGVIDGIVYADEQHRRGGFWSRFF